MADHPRALRRGLLRAAALLAACALGGCASGLRPPQFIGGADLRYPSDARDAGIEGVVVVRYDITAEGRVVNAEVTEAQPSGIFEAAALTAVRSWRFRSSTRDGQPVAAPGRVSELRFRLGEADVYAELPGAPR